MPDPVTVYEQAFAHTETYAFAVDQLDRLGVPVWATAAWTPDGAFCNGVGYGFDVAAAKASAWGELTESWAAHETVVRSEPVVASYHALVAEHGASAVLDPRAAILPAGTSWRPDADAAWLPAGDVLVLADLVATRFADLPPGLPEPVLTPITNGLGAGSSEEQARAHAVREIVQRDGNAVAYRALDQGVAIDVTSIRDEVARELLARYDAEGVDVTVKLAGISCGMASVYVVGRDRDPEAVPHPLALAAAGEAADPRREVAVRKALLEFAAARVRRIFNHGPLPLLQPLLPTGYLDRFRAQALGSEEGRSLAATREWAALTAEETLARLHRVHAVRRTVDLDDLPDGEDVDLEGRRVLWAPFDAPGDLHAGKAIVPGLEVEALSYGRIGPRSLHRLTDLGVSFAGSGSPAPEGATALPSAEGWLDRDAMDAAVGELYALYREPGRHVVALAAGD